MNFLLSVSPNKEMGNRTRQRKKSSLTELTTSGFVPQSVEQRLIKSGVRGFNFRRGRIFFPFPCAVSHFVTRDNAQWEIHRITLALKRTLQTELIPRDSSIVLIN